MARNRHHGRFQPVTSPKNRTDKSDNSYVNDVRVRNASGSSVSRCAPRRAPRFPSLDHARNPPILRVSPMLGAIDARSASSGRLLRRPHRQHAPTRGDHSAAEHDLQAVQMVRHQPKERRSLRASGLVDSACRRCRIRHTRSEGRKRRAYARPGRRSLPSDCARGSSDATSTGRRHNIACC